jgi:hypothetical protein
MPVTDNRVAEMMRCVTHGKCQKAFVCTHLLGETAGQRCCTKVGRWTAHQRFASFPRTLFRDREGHMYDYATDFVKAELQVGLTFSILGLQSMCADKASRNTVHVGTTAQQPPQQDLLLALSFCRAVYGLTFRKGRSGMLRRNNEVKSLAAC